MAPGQAMIAMTKEKKRTDFSFFLFFSFFLSLFSFFPFFLGMLQGGRWARARPESDGAPTGPQGAGGGGRRRAGVLRLGRRRPVTIGGTAVEVGDGAVWGQQRGCAGSTTANGGGAATRGRGTSRGVTARPRRGATTAACGGVAVGGGRRRGR